MDVDLTLFWISIGTMFVIVSLFYMLSRILRKSEFEAIAKNELRQLFISIIIALGVLALADIVIEISGILIEEFAQTKKDPFIYAENYIRILIDEGTNYMVQIWSLSFTIRHTKMKGVGISAPVAIKAPILLYSFLQEILGKWLGLLDIFFSFFVGSLHFQLIALQLFKSISFSLILPAGIILRSIPFTRSGGSFLIGLAFGMGFIFPFTYIINYEVSKIVWKEFENLQPTTNPLEKVFPSIEETYKTMFNLFDNFSRILPQSTILMIFSFTITITSISIFTEFIKEIE